MAVRVRIPSTATDRVSFTLSPLLEALWSLHSMRAPRAYPHNHQWLRSLRELPASLRRDLARFAVAYQGGPTALGIPMIDAARPTFEDEIARVRAASEEQARRYFTRAHTGEELTPGLPPSDVAAQLLAYTRKVRGSQELAESALSNPLGTLHAFSDVLERYWTTSFHTYWERTLPRLEESIAEAREQLRDGVYTLLSPLWPEVRIDPSGDSFTVKRDHEHEIDITPDRRLVLILSHFRPTMRIYCEYPDAVVLAFEPGIQVAPAAPPADLMAVLLSLADETRLRTLRYLRGHARSTQELSALVGVSEPTLSKHLHKLEDAGVLRSRREGYYLLYELAIDLAEDLRAKLEDYLGPPDAESTPAEDEEA